MLQIKHGDAGHLTMCCRIGLREVAVHSGPHVMHSLKMTRRHAYSEELIWACSGKIQVILAAKESPSRAVIWTSTEGLHLNDVPVDSEVLSKPNQAQLMSVLSSEGVTYVLLRLFQEDWNEQTIAACIRETLKATTLRDAHSVTARAFAKELVDRVNAIAALSLVNEMRLLATATCWDLDGSDFSHLSLIDDARFVSTSMVRSDTSCPIQEFVVALAEWILWVKSNSHNRAPSSEPLLAAYRKRQDWNVCGSHDFHRAAALTCAHLRGLERHTQRALSFLWGRQDLLFGLDLWTIKSLECDLAPNVEHAIALPGSTSMQALASLLGNRILRVRLRNAGKICFRRHRQMQTRCGQRLCAKLTVASPCPMGLLSVDSAEGRHSRST